MPIEHALRRRYNDVVKAAALEALVARAPQRVLALGEAVNSCLCAWLG
jgi:hypothetical protein